MKNSVVPVSSPMLVRLDAACRALAEAKTIDEAKHLRDTAETMRHYYAQRGYGLEAMNDAAEIKIRAERRIGELLAANPDFGRGKKSLTMRDLGIDHNESPRWQRIAKMSEEAFEAHIAQVRDAGRELTTAGVLRLAKELAQPGKQTEPPLQDGCTVDDLQQLIDDGELFGTIYADPPWPYSNQATRACTDDHYQTMPVEEIAALPIRELAADEAHLHLWTTNAFLFECPKILEAWGFEYKSVFVWCKPQMDMGNYWRVSHEFLVLGVRGAWPSATRG